MSESVHLQALALVNLLRLSSPALPVGAYSYSQGLEWAVDSGRIGDEAGAVDWIGGVLDSVVAGCEAPLTVRMYRAWQALDEHTLRRWNLLSLAARETAELHAETLQMGYSLAQLLNDLGLADEPRRGLMTRIEPCSFPCVYALAAVVMNIPEPAAVLGLLWSWLENQVAAAIKAIPLGQVAGQRVLAALSPRLPALAMRACGVDAPFDNFAPGLAIASSRHETQYSRLFRS